MSKTEAVVSIIFLVLFSFFAGFNVGSWNKSRWRKYKPTLVGDCKSENYYRVQGNRVEFKGTVKSEPFKYEA